MKSINEVRDRLKQTGVNLRQFTADPQIPPRIRKGLGNRRNSTFNLSSPDLDDLTISIYDEHTEGALSKFDKARQKTFKDLEDLEASKGIDALAWYISFHYDFDDWGIYIPFSSLEYLRNKYYPRSKQEPSAIWVKCIRILLAHEYHHFNIDYLIARWEIFLRKSIWVEAKAALSRSSIAYLPIDEAAAEAQLLRYVRSRFSKWDYHKWTAAVAAGPPGYRDGLFYLDDDMLQHACQETLKCYLSWMAPSLDLMFPVNLIDAISGEDCPWRDCPVFLVHDEVDVASQPVGISRHERVIISRETSRFQKAFRRLDRRVQAKWEKRKQEISVFLRPGVLEPLKGRREEWEIRFNGTMHRAIITQEKKSDPLTWVGENIGTHRDIGTGT